MKNMFKKHGVVKCVGGCLGLLGLLLAIISIFIKSDSATLVMGIISCLFIVVGLFLMAFQAEEKRTLKLIGAFIVAAIVITWILPYGYFQGKDFYDYGMQRVGLGDLSVAAYYSFNFTMDKILFLFVAAGFYGVLSVTNGYKQLVTSLAKKLQKHSIVSSIMISLIIVLLTAFISNTFIVLLFIPFFISVLSNMKIDKISTFGITFGSLLVGLLGSVFGTESLTSFNSYLGTEVTTAIAYRLIILVIAFVLYSFFMVMRLKKTLKDKNAETMEDPFVVEKPKKAVKSLPTIIVLGLLVIFIVLGYVSWNGNWSIEVFDKFHKWLTGLTIGDDFTIFGYILGTNAVAFGAFELFTSIIVLFVVSALLAFMNHVTFNEYVEAFFNGMKKMFKPILVVLGIYLVFVICYMSPFIPTITNWAYGLTSSFNPFIALIMAFVTSVFQVDLGYTAYSIGTYLTSAFASKLNIVHAIYTSMYGLVQLFMPTSIILMLGLTLTKVDYKSWFKYIWLYVVGMLIILTVFFTVVTYI